MLPMRKLLMALILLLGLVYLFTRLAEIENILETLRRGTLRFLILALFAQAAWLVNAAASLRIIYRNLGIEERLRDLLLIIAAANFVNIVTPSAGVGGMAIFISEARRKRYTAAQATVASALYVFFDYIGFLCVLAFGILVLFRRDKLTTTDLVASVLMCALALLLGLALYLGMRSEQALCFLLTRAVRFLNRLVRPFRGKRHPIWIPEQRAENFAHDIAAGLKGLKAQPRNLIWPLLLALSSKALLITVLFLVFLAFQVPISAGTLIAGFSIAFLFMIISPTPAGVGVVEGVLTLTLTSFYIPLHDSTVVAVAYRGITFWLPLLFGMLAFRWLNRRRKPDAQEWDNAN